MSRHITPPNTDLTLDQLRNRLQDKLAHLRERLAAMKIDPIRKRLIPHAENEIRSTERRLSFLSDKSARRSHE